MRLMITTPTSVVVDASGITSLRAEDASGAFGIHQGHANFITTLAVSVVTWRDAEGREHHAAVRKGVLSVHDGDFIEIATREAVDEQTLGKLGDAILTRFRDDVAAEDEARTQSLQLHLATIRRLQQYLRVSGRGSLQGPAPAFMDRFNEAEI